MGAAFWLEMAKLKSTADSESIRDKINSTYDVQFFDPY